MSTSFGSFSAGIVAARVSLRASIAEMSWPKVSATTNQWAPSAKHKVRIEMRQAHCPIGEIYPAAGESIVCTQIDRLDPARLRDH